jgi:hypothetical protein
MNYTYDEYCRIIGDLYLSANHQKVQCQKIIEQLNEQIANLLKDNRELREKCCTVCSFDNQLVLVYEPSPQDKVKAHAIYLTEYRRAELLGAPKEEDILLQIKIRGMWNDILQSELDSIPKSIEELKVELYNAYFQFKRRDNIKK